MKRIVCTVTNDLTHDRRMHRICEALQEAGYYVTLTGRELKSSQPLHGKSFQQKRLKCLFQKGFLFYAEFNIRLFWYLLFKSADVLYACDLDTALPVIIAGNLRGKRLVFDAHEHFTEVPEVERRKMVKGIWHAVGKWTIPKFHLRLTVGEKLAGVLSDAYKAPFAVVRNVPVLRALSVVPVEKRHQRIVYIGTLNEGRGLEQSIEAMKYLPAFELILIGEGDLSQILREQVHKARLTDRVIFKGWVSPETLHQMIAPAFLALNVLESRSKSYYYSLANKFFDYIHAGVPSINMEFPEYMAILDKYPVGVAIPELKPEEIALAVKRLSENSVQYQSMVMACESAKGVFCWQKEKEALLQFFEG